MTPTSEDRGARADDGTRPEREPASAGDGTAGGASGVLDETVREVEALEAEGRQNERRQDRIAHRITAATGTMTFVGINILFFATWVTVNLPGMPTRFDPFPFPLLTTMVSLEAIILAVLVLISENAQAQRSDRRARVEMQVNVLAEREITRLVTLVAEIHESLGLERPTTEDVDEMARTTRLKQVARAVDAASVDTGGPEPEPQAGEAEAERKPRSDTA